MSYQKGINGYDWKVVETFVHNPNYNMPIFPMWQWGGHELLHANCPYATLAYVFFLLLILVIVLWTYKY